MKISLRINRHTTESELVHLGMFFTAIGLNRGAKVASGCTAEPTFTVPLDEAELTEPDTTIIPADDAQAQAPAEVPAGTEAPKRRRRTKAEIEAAEAVPLTQPSDTQPSLTQPEEVAAAEAAEEAAVAKGEAEAQASNEAELAKLTAGNETPAPTPDAPPPATPPSETASTAPVSASPSNPTGPITHAEAQKQAIDVARRFGPEKVKAIIAEYEGVGKIADLKDTDLVGFVAKLQALAA